MSYKLYVDSYLTGLKNSTLVPIRDEKTGKLKYVDFSHSNAYDVISDRLEQWLMKLWQVNKRR